jgi:hypothetical protein
MCINITWRTTVLALIGLVAIATAGLNSSALSRGLVARSAAADPVDCNVHDPLSPCFAANLGYPAGDLFVEYYN